MSDFTGIVIRSTGSWYAVKTNNEIINCRLRRKFKIKGIKTTNPIAVGDIVKFISDGKNGYITAIEDRKNCIIRKATNLSKQTHIVAANLDLAILVVTLAYPRTSTGFIDRFLSSAEAYDVETALVWNKIDIYDARLFELTTKYAKIYSNVGYQCFMVSAKTSENIEQIKTLLKDKKTLMFGHSGVGKSELINAIHPELKLKTKEISLYHKKGKHATTFAEMFDLPFGGSIIDTPGIKEFGLVDFNVEELSHWFPEMKKVLSDCKFYNCTHIHEPQCAVRKAVENGEISEERYYNYLSILNNVEEQPAGWE